MFQQRQKHAHDQEAGMLSGLRRIGCVGKNNRMNEDLRPREPVPTKTSTEKPHGDVERRNPEPGEADRFTNPEQVPIKVEPALHVVWFSTQSFFTHYDNAPHAPTHAPWELFNPFNLSRHTKRWSIIALFLNSSFFTHRARAI